MNIPKELSEICKVIPDEIFIVGGFVRDFFLGLVPIGKGDIDICGAFDIQTYFDDLSKLGFEVTPKNISYGVFSLSKNNVTIEYSRLRTEKYKVAGKHSPTSVEFISDIKIDAKRRDFTSNCIYFSVKSGEFFDFYNGRADIESSTLRTIETPQVVFHDDALRILRMVRFACLLDFEIENKTLTEAKNNVFKLAHLSAGVMRKEIEKIAGIESVYKRRANGRVKRAKELLSSIGTFEFLSSEMIDLLR